jgi:maleylpyruvate isomerase
MTAPILHGYWRSSASYRVRLGLNLKNLAFDQVSVDLRAGEQRSEAYRALNPQGLVPALEIDGHLLVQSTAILEWLDERYPEPPLLPAEALARAEVRATAAMVACDIQPLNNLRVLQSIKRDLGATDEQHKAWIERWIHPGFEAVEARIARFGGAWAFGDAPGLIECCLIPQVYNARRFEVELTSYPRIVALEAQAALHPAFVASHPDQQPDAT